MLAGWRGPKFRLRGPRVHIRPARRSDQKQWLALRAASREFLEPWEPTWAGDALTPRAFKRRLVKFHDDWRRETAYAFLIFENGSNRLLGGITVANVRRGVVQSANVGYWIGAPNARQGFMAEALQLALDFCFTRLRLHRVEAACLPHNMASRGLLAKSGFREEGLARQYLCINGRWQDHVTHAILATDNRPVVPSVAD